MQTMSADISAAGYIAAALHESFPVELRPAMILSQEVNANAADAYFRQALLADRIYLTLHGGGHCQGLNSAGTSAVAV